MNEEDRRDLIARQHRALYGNDGQPYDVRSFGDASHTPRPPPQSAGGSTSASGRGQSPRNFEPFSFGQSQAQMGHSEAVGQMQAPDQNQQSGGTGPSPKPQQQRSRANSNSSPASNSQTFSLFDNPNTQESSRTSTSSPGDAPNKNSAPSSAGVAPIGTRPQSQAVNPALNKRSTTPLPSPLSYGFASKDKIPPGNERSDSASSNPPAGPKESSMPWGSGSGAWGKKPLGVQASVWG